jgi:DNA-binding protein H-NS
MPTYQEYQEQIAKLQVLAEQARQDEITEAKKRVRELMAANGLTVADLVEPKRAASTKKQGSVAAKYRDPSSGQTWTGRGRAPRWLTGKNKDEFLIK